MLTEDHSNATYQIKSFSPGKIVVNSDVLTTSFIISPEKLIKNWHPQTTDQITDDDLKQLLETKPDIILLGTGEKSVILPATKIAVLLEKQYHVECMNSVAACRTYTILIAEGRKVVAGLII
ncbi:MAG: hypothetical protein ACD_42C00472G0003 [uncultured bacterium]|nr:MAG: hypothetical protein ACD_42C00472G0003 [uncultured bacterium]OGT33877.1 MAG: hypothetical protein A3C44_02445 [Gammaproteobacteria bacterium RIFCSPHIGHO2_02_FULL_39_13]OGT50128.1 MAG: hypothetical protein A3E53_01750 [Gammaproteobacteria bacterium RIFCSPHIGHO2_12_FULL_39_24]